MNADELIAELSQANRRRQAIRQATRRLLVMAAILLLVAGFGFVERAHWLPYVYPSARAAPPPQRSDGDILADVNHALSKVDDAENVLPSVAEGEVRLSGEVPSQTVLDESTRAAKVLGATGVDNSGLRVVAAASTATLAETRSPLARRNPVSLETEPPTGVQATGRPTAGTAGAFTEAQPSAAEKSAPPPPAAAQPNGLPVSADDKPSPSKPVVAQKYREKPEVEQLLAQARTERDQVQFDKALADCDAALKLDPRSPAARKEKQKTLSAKAWYEANNQ